METPPEHTAEIESASPKSPDFTSLRESDVGSRLMSFAAMVQEDSEVESAKKSGSLSPEGIGDVLQDKEFPVEGHAFRGKHYGLLGDASSRTPSETPSKSDDGMGTVRARKHRRRLERRRKKRRRLERQYAREQRAFVQDQLSDWSTDGEQAKYSGGKEGERKKEDEEQRYSESSSLSSLSVSSSDSEMSGSHSGSESEDYDEIISQCNYDALRTWLVTRRESSTDPLKLLNAFGFYPAENVAPNIYWRLLFEIVEELREAVHPRLKLPLFNSIDDAVNLIRNSKRILVLTGAGISVSCGIPDFRSAGGIYHQVQKYHLDDPTDMFDLQYFRRNPHPFFDFVKKLLPGLFDPSPSHHFIGQLEKNGKLLRNYSQNIDSLESFAGINNYIQCHGTFDEATCIHCRQRYVFADVRETMLTGDVPHCTACNHPEGIIKPDIVFFGEKLSTNFEVYIDEDLQTVDLVIVMGSSLKVKPVSGLCGRVPRTVPQILINREVVGQPHQFDIELLGDCDIIVSLLCRQLGWDLTNAVPPRDIKPTLYKLVADAPEEVRNTLMEYKFRAPNRYYFHGATFLRPLRPKPGSAGKPGKDDKTRKPDDENDDDDAEDKHKHHHKHHRANTTGDGLGGLVRRTYGRRGRSGAGGSGKGHGDGGGGGGGSGGAAQEATEEEAEEAPTGEESGAGGGGGERTYTRDKSPVPITPSAKSTQLDRSSLVVSTDPSADDLPGAKLFPPFVELMRDAMAKHPGYRKSSAARAAAAASAAGGEGVYPWTPRTVAGQTWDAGSLLGTAGASGARLVATQGGYPLAESTTVGSAAPGSGSLLRVSARDVMPTTRSWAATRASTRNEERRVTDKGLCIVEGPGPIDDDDDDDDEDSFSAQHLFPEFPQRQLEDAIVKQDSHTRQVNVLRDGTLDRKRKSLMRDFHLGGFARRYGRLFQAMVNENQQPYRIEASPGKIGLARHPVLL